MTDLCTNPASTIALSRCVTSCSSWHSIQVSLMVHETETADLSQPTATGSCSMYSPSPSEPPLLLKHAILHCQSYFFTHRTRVYWLRVVIFGKIAESPTNIFDVYFIDELWVELYFSMPPIIMLIYINLDKYNAWYIPKQSRICLGTYTIINCEILSFLTILYIFMR